MIKNERKFRTTVSFLLFFMVRGVKLNSLYSIVNYLRTKKTSKYSSIIYGFYNNDPRQIIEAWTRKLKV